MKSLNLNRKVKNFHLTYKGWYMLDIPYIPKVLMYCYEKEDEEHTHCILSLYEGVTVNEIIRELTLFLEIPCEIDVQTHQHIETAIGYHLGFGDKPRCTLNHGLLPVFPFDFDCDDYIRKKVMHKPRGVFQNQTRNGILIATANDALIDQGDIPLEKLECIIKNKEIYASLKDDPREELDVLLDNTWGLRISCDREYKKCNWWIWSNNSDLGKSTFARKLVAKYRGVIKTKLWEWWDIRKDCDIICLDAYRGGLKWSDLEDLCDGSYDFNVKYRGIIRLDQNPVIIVLSNFPFNNFYPEDRIYFDTRFTEVNIDNMKY